MLAVLIAILCTAVLGCQSSTTAQGDISGGPGQVITLVDAGAADRPGGQLGTGGAGPGSGPGGSSGAEAGGGGGGAAGACPPPGLSPACATCETSRCTGDDFVSGIGQDIDWYGDCYATKDVATDGPAKGTAKATLCKAVVDCVHRTGCDVADNNFPCYCGVGVSGDDCVNPGVAHGPCKTEIEAASESTMPQVVATRRFDNSYASGDGLGLVLLCDLPPDNPLNGSHPCTSACLTGAGGGGGGSGCLATTTGGASGTGVGGSTGQGGQGGSAQGTGSTGGQGGDAGTNPTCKVTYAFADGQACSACALASPSPFCAPQTLLSAKLTMNPDSGEQAPDGFGPDTLATPAQREAAYALMHRVLELRCYSDSTLTYRPSTMPGCETSTKAAPCIFSNLGCLLDLGQSPTDVGNGLFSSNATSSALAEYRAAAIADASAGHAAPEPVDGSGYAVPGGVPASVTNAALGGYINQWAVYPSSAVGIADNVLACALNTGCTACLSLIATSSCTSGGAGGAGGAAGGGGAGAGGRPGTGGAGEATSPGGSGGGGGSGGHGGGIGGAAPASGPGGAAGARTGGSTGSLGSGGASSGGASVASGGASAGGGPGGAGATAGGGSLAGAPGSAGSGESTGTGGAAGPGGAGDGAAAGCPDLDRDGIPDCEQTLLANPSFDSSTSGWTAGPGSGASWTSLDGVGNPASGALVVTNRDTNPRDATNGAISAGAFQCIPVTTGVDYTVSVQVYLPAGQGAGWAGFVLDDYFSPDCSGSPVTLPFLSAQVTAGVVGQVRWQAVSGTTTQTPLGVRSRAVRLVVVKPTAQISLEARFDNVLVRVQ
jgi:hypothetical protein